MSQLSQLSQYNYNQLINCKFIQYVCDNCGTATIRDHYLVCKSFICNNAITVIIEAFGIVFNNRRSMMPFKPGHSGNVKGRPKGLQDRRAAFKAVVEPQAHLLLQKALDMALDGNEPMLRVLLDRVLPAKLRDDPVSIDITSDCLVGKVTKIINALYDGSITPIVAKTLMDTVAVEIKILEYDVLEKRLAQVEQAMKDPFPDKGWTEE